MRTCVEQEREADGASARKRTERRSSRKRAGASAPRRGSIAAVRARLAPFGVAVALLFGGSDDGHKYTFLFETGRPARPRQPGARRRPAESARSTRIDLTDDNQAAVTVTLDEPLREGTTAVIRSTSLSGVANRYISLTLGPNNAAEIPDGDDDRRHRHDRARSTSTSSSTSSGPRSARRCRSSSGQRHRLLRQGAARQPRLQVPQPGAEHLPAALRRALERLAWPCSDSS